MPKPFIPIFSAAGLYLWVGKGNYFWLGVFRGTGMFSIALSFCYDLLNGANKFNLVLDGFFCEAGRLAVTGDESKTQLVLKI